MLQQLTVKQFINAYNDAQVYYDLSFQRRFGAWVGRQMNRYLLKLFGGKAHTLIVVADVAQCLEHSRLTGQVNSAKAFEKILERGYKWISLDGQHRTKTTLKFFTNETTITGVFVDALGASYALTNVYWKDVPIGLKSQFLGALLAVSHEVDSLYEDLSQHFRDLNSGSATNDQEDRNSYSTPVAEWIRAHRDAYRASLARMVSGTDVLRMLDDELLAKFTMVIIDSYRTKEFTADPDVNKDMLDRFYTMGVGCAALGSKASPYDPAAFKRAQEILDMAMQSFADQTYYPPSKSIAAKAAWSTLHACEWAVDNGFVITNYTDFFDEVKKIDDDLFDQGERAFIAAKDAKIQAGEDPGDVPRGRYYHAWTTLPHQKGPRRKRRAAIQSRLDTYVATNDLASLAMVERQDLAA